MKSNTTLLPGACGPNQCMSTIHVHDSHPRIVRSTDRIAVGPYSNHAQIQGPFTYLFSSIMYKA